MNRRVALLVLSAFLLAHGFAIPADAAIPEGPRLAISVFGGGPGAEDEFSEVITTGAAGEDPRTLLRGSGASIGDGLSWSADADGSSVIVELLNRKGSRIVAIDTDTDRSRRLARLPLDAQEPTYSSDGTKLAYVRDKTKGFNLPKPDLPISELWVAMADGQ